MRKYTGSNINGFQIYFVPLKKPEVDRGGQLFITF